MEAKSLPSRERGLKFRAGKIQSRKLMVAPLTGAWIEIEQLPGQMEIIESLPSRERGLKLQIIDQKTFASIVAPWSYVKI